MLYDGYRVYFAPGYTNAGTGPFWIENPIYTKRFILPQKNKMGRIYCSSPILSITSLPGFLIFSIIARKQYKRG